MTQNTTSYQDRRLFTRHEATDGVFAVLRGSSTVLGQIVDISEGGLSFRYLEDMEPDHGLKNLSILFGAKSMFIENLPFETVRDEAINPTSSFTHLNMRVRAVSFRNIPAEVVTRLKHAMPVISGEATAETNSSSPKKSNVIRFTTPRPVNSIAAFA